ncbi:MAG: protein phosphatase 2C domain-containing protein [Candidatus Adiutrix sp.]|jgi:serine/threonine protein phosphatase PrpC|nr:protein phosphatase 2C domain-containing protein [Candidatus Adiutrix sp.]
MNQPGQSGTPFYFLGQDAHVGYDHLVNEDDCGCFSTPAGELFILADGFRGHAGGGVASRLAVSTFHQVMREVSGEPEILLREALAAADEAVASAGRDFAELQGLGSSLVALLLRKTEAWYIHVGDSRLYLASAGGLRRLTSDLRTPRADGQTLGATVDLNHLQVGRHPFRADDTFLLCTSGLSALVTEKEIQAILARPASPQLRARGLIEAAVRTGGSDNITVQVVAFKPGPGEDNSAGPGRASSSPKAFLLGAGCGLALGAALMWALVN